MRTQGNIYSPQADIHDKAKAPTKGNGATPPPLMPVDCGFIASFETPEYVLAGVLQRRFIYALPACPAPARRRSCCQWPRTLHLAVIFPPSMNQRRAASFISWQKPLDIEMRLLRWRSNMILPLTKSIS